MAREDDSPEGWTFIQRRLETPSATACQRRRSRRCTGPCCCKEYRSSRRRGFFSRLSNKLRTHSGAILTILLVAIFSFLIPDVSQKIRDSTQMSSLNELIDWIKRDVNNAQRDCITAANNVCSIHCNILNNNDKHGLDEYCSCTSELGTLTDEKNIGFFEKIFMCPHNISNKEIKIMSFTYSDWIASHKTINSGTSVSYTS